VFVGQEDPTTARTVKAFTINPGYQARVPIVLDSPPDTSLYYLEPVDISQNVKVANSIASTDATVHYAHIIDLGKGQIKLPEGSIVGSSRPVSNVHLPSVPVNFTNAGTKQRFESDALEEAIKEMDINPELSLEQREQLKGVIRRQQSAFAYGSRTLGHTD
jgi:hypothetical protein